MLVTVLFPKLTSYVGKGIDTQRTFNDIFKRYIGLLTNANCSIEVLVEDELALMQLKSMGVNSIKYITCIGKSDISFVNSFPGQVNIGMNTLLLHGNAECVAGDVEKKFIVPISLVKEDREAYMSKRTDAFWKRVRLATDNLVSTRKNVLMFRMNNNNDRCIPVRETVSMGDGRLCIEVDMRSGVAISYYGGTYITEDLLPAILSL